MSFEELYESCFRNISLVKCSSDSAKDQPGQISTLETAMSSSQYVVFLLASSSRGTDVAARLNSLAKKRNERDREKPQNSPARIRRLFSLKKKKKKEIIVDETNFMSIVYLDTDQRNDDAPLKVAYPGWYIYVPQSPASKSRLLRALGFEFPPSIIVVDCNTHAVITTEGRRLLVDDPNGANFPWWPPAVSDLMKGQVVRSVNGKVETSDYSEIKTAIRGFFFGAYWFPTCRQWVKQLKPVYDALKEANISIEIIFCSSDRSLDFFNQFLNQMPWYAFSYDTAKTMGLTRFFNVNGIPSLILVDSNNQIISRHGRSTLLADSLGKQFPWGPCPLYELDEFSVCRLRDEPSMVLFTEGSPEDIGFSLSVLDGISKKLFDERQKIEEQRREDREKKLEDRENSENGNSISKSSSSEECASTTSEVPIPPQADPLQIFYTGEDPICDHILEKILGLGDSELPLICIIDSLAGQMSICDKPDVSDEVIEEFVNDYKSGKLEWISLPTPKDGSKTGTGIPASMIEDALANSPSQNSLNNENEPRAV
ncbi:unnamed protein product [Auanema sp. JU1783]|nr:unnamed protein product [Auanema sp. JU1783]